MPKKEPVKVKVIKSFKELKAMLDVPINCQFDLDGVSVELPCQRLMPGVQEQVLKLLREAQPPFKRERGPHGDFDWQSPAYLEARETNQRLARSLVIYTGCPAIAAEKPGLTDLKKIHEFVSGLLPETVCEVISLTIQKGGVDLRERSNFTSTPGLET